LVVCAAGRDRIPWSSRACWPAASRPAERQQPVRVHVAKGKITDKANKQAVESSYKALSKAPHVSSAPDPFANAASGLVSKDADDRVHPVLLDIPNGDVTEELADSLLDTTAPARKAGVEVAVGGNLAASLSQSSTESSEVIGLLAAMLILALTFGSLVAMGMPIITAVVGLATALGLIGLLGHLLKIPTVGPTLATMIGLGVGIDYALFLVTKHPRPDGGRRRAARVDRPGGGDLRRRHRVRRWHRDHRPPVAVGGRHPLVASLGYASAVAVLTAVLAGHHAPARGPVAGRRAPVRRPAAGLPPPPGDAGGGDVWSRWAATSPATRWPAGWSALALLVPLIVPCSRSASGQEDVGATQEATTERQAFDLMAARYGPGYNGPLVTAGSS
jgi:uncharacterized membrane protein YdfJ with MMPL/SSD domain